MSVVFGGPFWGSLLPAINLFDDARTYCRRTNDAQGREVLFSLFKPKQHIQGKGYLHMSNQALNALAATVSQLDRKEGLPGGGQLASKSPLRLSKIGALRDLPFISGAFLTNFRSGLPSAEKINKSTMGAGIIGVGLKTYYPELDRPCFSVTEARTREDIDALRKHW